MFEKIVNRSAILLAKSGQNLLKIFRFVKKLFEHSPILHLVYDGFLIKESVLDVFGTGLLIAEVRNWRFQISIISITINIFISSLLETFLKKRPILLAKYA